MVKSEKKLFVNLFYFLSVILFLSCNTSNKNKISESVIVVDETEKELNLSKVELSTKEPIVFITGYDKGNETFYNNAREYFNNKNYKIVEDQYSIEEIINWLNNNESELTYGDIHIVNKSDSFNGMTLETLIRGDKVSSESLRRSITKGELPILNESINSNSKIILHANGVGEDSDLMNTFKDAFFAEELPTVIASPYYSIFNGSFLNHYLAKPFHVFYPTANSPGKVDLSKEIAKKYPEEKDVNWYEALSNDQERFVGDPYVIKDVIPIVFDLDYHNSDDEIPSFETQNQIMDFIENKEELYSKVKKFNIPIEKYRWTWNFKNSKVTIKGSTTVLTVLKPIIKPYGELEHVKPDTENKRLYAMK